MASAFHICLRPQNIFLKVRVSCVGVDEPVNMRIIVKYVCTVCLDPTVPIL